MGMDGLSFSNTGTIRESTSRDFAAQVEETVRKDDSTKQVDKMGVSPRIKEDEEKEQKGKQQDKKSDSDDEAGVYVPAETPEDEKTSIKELMDNEDDLSSRKFYVKITKDGEIFELYDKDTNRLVEKISAEEINQLMLKLNMASGILINRKI